MEKVTVFVILAAAAALLLRLLALPLRLAGKLAANALCGLVCLTLLNSVSAYTGVYLPVNAVTALLAGTLGLPGIAAIALLESVR
jgi:inhibitor of the pro-sigma K processing machinery